MTKNVGLLFSVDDTILWFIISIEQDNYIALLSNVRPFMWSPKYTIDLASVLKGWWVVPILENGLIYRLIRRRIIVAKSFIGGKWVWFLMG